MKDKTLTYLEDILFNDDGNISIGCAFVLLVFGLQLFFKDISRGIVQHLPSNGVN